MGKIWNHNKIAYGGDYNPEQWPEEVWEEDMRCFKLAGIDIVTLNVFSWASLQKDDEVYDFERLDKIIKLCTENDLKICLATSTGAHPAWMARKYPEILRTDFDGRKHKFGGRHNSCPNSPVYRRYSSLLAYKLSERYKDNKNIIAWHVSNEYGGDCYCENCEKAFRVWLKDRYKTIDEVNKAWNMSFWGHTLYDFDDVVAPSNISEHFPLFGRDRTQFQSISIDYRRFMTESIVDCYKLERDEIRKNTPDIPVTTNLMGFYPVLDYRKFAKEMEFISWDNYPSPHETPAEIAICHELMKGLKSGQSFCLMEQTPSVTNWQPFNKLKRPNEMRLLSYQAVAHGSDSVMFFQMRRSIGACEKYHGAVIDHAGRTDTRVFREITALGDELKKLGDITLGARSKARAAIIYDWENRWGIEYSAGPSILIDYRREVTNYYEVFHKNNIACDLIGPDEDFSKYDLIIAPILYMVKGDMGERLEKYVAEGGVFATTYFSGYVEEHDLVTGAYPGKLKDLLGIWVEESDALPEGEKNSFTRDGKTYEASILLDLIHTEGAEVLSSYNEDFYAGTPMFTVNSFGKGKAYYIGCSSDKEFYKDFVLELCEKADISKELSNYEGLEAVSRYNDSGSEILFLLNHNKSELTVKLHADMTDAINKTEYKKGQEVTFGPRDVMIFSINE